MDEEEEKKEDEEEEGGDHRGRETLRSGGCGLARVFLTTTTTGDAPPLLQSLDQRSGGLGQEDATGWREGWNVQKDRRLNRSTEGWVSPGRCEQQGTIP